MVRVGLWAFGECNVSVVWLSGDIVFGKDGWSGGCNVSDAVVAFAHEPDVDGFFAEIVGLAQALECEPCAGLADQVSKRAANGLRIVIVLEWAEFHGLCHCH